MATLSIEFPPTVAGRAFENTIAQNLTDSALSFPLLVDGDIVFDFSEVVYFDIYCLQLFVAYISKCEALSITPRIELPRDEGVRNTFRVWGLDYALITATNKSLLSMATQNSRDKYWQQADRKQGRLMLNGMYPKCNASRKTTSNRLWEQLKENQYDWVPRDKYFLGFHTYDLLAIPSQVKIANDEKSFWENNKWISKYFMQRTGLDSGYLASRIIWETLFNSMRHSGAIVAQTSSLILPPGGNTKGGSGDPLSFALKSEIEIQKPIKGTTTFINFWDDGSDMLSVLKQKLVGYGDASSKLRTGHDDEFFTRYKISFFDRDKVKKVDFIDSNLEFNSSFPDQILLTALTFPYLSSSPELPGHDADEDVKRMDHRRAARGMGLYNLLRAVVISLSGEVRFRFGEYYVRIRKNGYKGIRHADEWQHDFNVEVWEQDASLPPIKGNLISVKIPAQIT